MLTFTEVETAREKMLAIDQAVTRQKRYTTHEIEIKTHSGRWISDLTSVPVVPQFKLGKRQEYKYVGQLTETQRSHGWLRKIAQRNGNFAGRYQVNFLGDSQAPKRTWNRHQSGLPNRDDPNGRSTASSERALVIR